MLFPVIPTPTVAFRVEVLGDIEMARPATSPSILSSIS